jgi:alpha-L-rhamnosidase
MERTGWFEASDPLVNQLHENIVWGLRGNFLYLPTDCPQRDERLGWTGDIQVFAPTASFLYDVRGFLDSWLRDLALEQVDGVVPFVVPNVLGAARPAAAWGDAATIVPWVLHERYADVATVERQYPSMRGWADALIELAGPRRLWEGMFQFGDWLDPDAPPHLPANAKTGADVVASAYLFRSADAVARAAALLGKDDEARQYAAIAEEVRTAFLTEYVTPGGRMMSDAQTAYAMAIVFDIAPADQQQALGARLAELTRLSGYRIGTGFVGTPIIQDALTRTGHLETARRLLTQTESPSWLYPVTMGATTVWERWDSMLPDGSINPGEMTSFNHYALGAIGDWLHRVVAGLAPEEPAYARLRIQPHPLVEFDHAWAEHLTPYGTARAGWRREDGVVRVEAVVPPNTTAVVVLPDGRELEVGSGSHEWEVEDAAAPVAATRIGLDSTLADVIDDREAYRAIVEVLEAADPEVAHAFRTNTTWSERRELGDALFMHAGPDTQRLIEERLAELSARRERVTVDA